LELKDVTKEFILEGGKHLVAVDRLSLTLYQGECLGIVGESGCGKSTVAKLLTHMQEVTSGDILFRGQSITYLRKEALRQSHRTIQMVFQDPASVFSPRMKVGAFLAEPLLNFKVMNRADVQKEIVRLLEQVGLPEAYTDQFAHQLSGGEQQRVAIARAIAIKPDVIVYDEATSALDVSIQSQITELLIKLQKELKMSYVFIGHDLALVRSISNRIAVMYLGRLVEVVDSEQLVAQALHPYTKALLAAVLSVKGERSKQIEIIEGDPPSTINRPQGCTFSSRCSMRQDICLHTLPTLSEVGKDYFVACHFI
jgi:oligopeptide/dipeptide ABC transporter ATP-binding protein